jgi:hypothetical protein
MIQLIKNIEGQILTNYIGEVNYVSLISGEIQQEDYINLNGFIGFLQNLKKTEETQTLLIPNPMGLNNQFNKQIINLEINY